VQVKPIDGPRALQASKQLVSSTLPRTGQILSATTRMKTLSLPLASALGAALLLAACKKSETPGASGSSTGSPAAASAAKSLSDPPQIASCEPGTRGGRLVIATFGDPKTFNPITENETSSKDIIRLLFLGLVEFDWQTEEV